LEATETTTGSEGGNGRTPPVPEGMEKTPLQSKKFVAFLVAEASWKVILLFLIFFGHEALPQALFVIMLTVVLVAGFIEAGYILGQAALDKYTRLAHIAVNSIGSKPNGATSKMVSQATKGLVEMPPTSPEAAPETPAEVAEKDEEDDLDPPTEYDPPGRTGA